MRGLVFESCRAADSYWQVPLHAAIEKFESAATFFDVCPQASANVRRYHQ